MKKPNLLKPFLLGIVRFLLALTVVGGLGYLAFGVAALWFAVSLLLLLALLYQYSRLAALAKWLHDENYPLSGSGVWGDIFGQILHLRRNSLKRKAALSAALNRFSRVTDVIPSGIIVLTDGRIEWLNAAACEHLSLHPSQDRYHFLRNLIRQPDFQHFLHRKLGIQPHTITLTLPKPPHFERIVQLTRQPFDEKSELLLTQDITEKEKLDETQIAFISNISHELRTPLTVLNGFTETLLDTPDLPMAQRQQFLGLMQKDGQRMLSVLTDLLTLSCLEKGQHDDTFLPFNLSFTVQQIVEATENLSRGKHRIATCIQPNLLFYGLESELYSALSNIAFNAVRYTPEQGNIDITLQQINDTQAVFEVADSGIGIAAEHIPRLTERFYRVDNARSRQTGGTGLGLAITKFALAKYHAELVIKSAVGKGSVFTVTLPLTPTASPDLRHSSPPEH